MPWSCRCSRYVVRKVFIVRLLTYYTSILATITRAWLWLCDWEMTTRSVERMSPSLSPYSVDSQAARTHWQRSKFAIFLQNKNTTKSRMRRYRVAQQTDLSLVHLPAPQLQLLFDLFASCRVLEINSSQNPFWRLQSIFRLIPAVISLEQTT